jgi:hypothetical protein
MSMFNVAAAVSEGAVFVDFLIEGCTPEKEPRYGIGGIEILFTHTHVNQSFGFPFLTLLIVHSSTDIPIHRE